VRLKVFTSRFRHENSEERQQFFAQAGQRCAICGEAALVKRPMMYGIRAWNLRPGGGEFGAPAYAALLASCAAPPAS
jgi:hypothetical protein